MLLYCIYWTPYRGIDTKVKISLTLSGLFYWTPYRGIDTDACVPLFQVYTSIEPLIGGLILNYHGAPPAFIIYWTPYRGIDTIAPPMKWNVITPMRGGNYWTPYRGIEMLICFPWEGSGGGVVYGFGVWRVKSWVKNVLNTNKYIAIFSIKWGWSPLTYLSLVVIIFEKSIILFYWTPYRGIETFSNERVFSVYNYWTPYRGIDTWGRM